MYRYNTSQASDEKEFRGYCKGNNIKYTFREKTKVKMKTLKKHEYI